MTRFLPQRGTSLSCWVGTGDLFAPIFCFRSRGFLEDRHQQQLGNTWQLDRRIYPR